MKGARGLLINITGGEDMTLFEVDQAANRIREEVDEDANIIFGSAIDEGLQGKVRVSVVATGIDSPAISEAQRPRLVAVGGNAMPGPIPMPAAMAAQAAAQAEAAQQPVFTQGPVALQRQAATQPGAHAGPPMIEQAAEPAAARQQSVAGAPQPGGPGRAAPQPAAQSARRGGLFADAPRTTVAAGPPAAPPPINGQAVNGTEARRSIFQTVTGRLRNSLSGAGSPPTDPNQLRSEPQTHEAKPEPARASVRPAASEEMGLDIPAFLRRQSS